MTQARLHVSEGPDRGLSHLLGPGARCVIGRAEGCDLRLHDAQASRRQCLLELRGAELWVEDLGSRAGTELLGRVLRGEGELVAAQGARLRIGGSELRVELLAAAEPWPEVPGFRLLERLGAGASGEVYAAQDLASGAEVALKVLARQADAETLARAGREAALAGRLAHPGIARVLRVLPGPPLTLVRELAQGPTLAARLERSPLPWAEALALGAQLGDALAVAHAAGVIHRDLKPANVVCTARGPCLIDFDLALGLGGEGWERTLTRLTRTGQGLGTLCYLPPEQLRDARSAGPLADVYGLGLTLHHALTGRQPFAEVAPEELLRAIAERGPAPLRGLPRGVAEAVGRAHALRPADRYPSAQACAAAWRALLPA